MMELCRICLTIVNENNSISLLQKLNNKKSVLELIQECASIQVLAEDILPQYVCTKCFGKLNCLFAFRTLIINSDRQLKENLKNAIETKNELQDEEIDSKNGENRLNLAENVNVFISNQNETPEFNTPTSGPDSTTEEYITQEENETAKKISAKLEIKNDKIISDQNKLQLQSELKLRLYKKKKANISVQPPKIKRKRKYECKICQKMFGSRHTLSKHTIEHTGVEPYHCEICGKGFCLRFSLKVHMRIHTGDKPFVCDVCDKSFGFHSSLLTHKKMHEGVKPHVCDLCNKSFFQLVQLQGHRRRHTGERPFLCHVCSKTFCDQSSLHKHMMRHKGLEEDCPICGKRYSKMTLKEHIKRHKGLKLNTCEVCGAKFSSAQTLKTHKAIHDGLRAFSCKLCENTFTQRGSLAKHMKIHTGDRPFQCDFCEKDFVYKHHLQGHVKNVHKVELNPSDGAVGAVKDDENCDT